MIISIKYLKSRFFVIFLVLGLIFGVLFYDYIQMTTGFSYIDEILAVLLFIFTIYISIKKKSRAIEKYWIFLFGIWGFYLAYSFYIESNCSSAIIQDSIVQLKPYLGFFCAYSIAPDLTKKQMDILRTSCYFSLICLFFISFDMSAVMGHPSRFATATVFVALLFLFSSEFNKRNLLIFMLILALGLLSGRSKSYGFFAFILLFYLYLYKKESLKFSLKTLISIGLIIVTIVYVAWGKIYHYFIYGSLGMEDGDIANAFARPALYITSGKILVDYFPFGSGFSSFATHFSAIYYSEVYHKYGLDYVHGLSEEMPDFISDTFYPSLAQFGIIGVFLFAFFWIYILKKVSLYKLNQIVECKKLYLIIIGIIAFFLIESIADSTFTHNRGFFILVVLGGALAALKRKSLKNACKDN